MAKRMRRMTKEAARNAARAGVDEMKPVVEEARLSATVVKEVARAEAVSLRRRAVEAFRRAKARARAELRAAAHRATEPKQGRRTPTSTERRRARTATASARGRTTAKRKPGSRTRTRRRG